MRFAIPLAVLTAVAAAVLFVTQPWQEQEAAGTTTTFSLCNVSIDVPAQPELFEITPVFETLELAEKSLGLRVSLKEGRKITNPKTGAVEHKRSGVAIDPETGQ
ncbi:MAG: hypothetical protein HYY03_04620, partial [Chloroflexi bacterium]|nr:hypothetical protein [Chloroflexota bacterium]